MRRKWSGSDEGVKSLIRKILVVLLPATAPATIINLKRGNFVAGNLGGNDAGLSCAKMAAYKVLKQARNSVDLKYGVTFQGVRQQFFLGSFRCTRIK